MNTPCLTNDSAVSVFYPATVGEDSNRFEIKLKDSKVFNSLDNFFYPVSCKDSIQLLYLNSTFIVVKKSDVDLFTVHGCRRNSQASEVICLKNVEERGVQDEE